MMSNNRPIFIIQNSRPSHPVVNETIHPDNQFKVQTTNNLLYIQCETPLQVCSDKPPSGADPGIYFGGGQTKVPNRKLRAKPESRARSAQVSRAQSARELRAKLEPRAKPEKKRGEGSGEGAR